MKDKVQLLARPLAAKDRTSEGKIRSLWKKVNSHFWFLPILGTAGGIVLSVATYHVDRNADARWTALPIFFSGGSSDAHYMLSAITGSLITVIATAFSLTLVVLQLASGQYSPRLLRSFKSDRGLQVALGTYIATFVYSLMTLKRMYTPDTENATLFVPVVSVSVAIFLALVCVAMLTYFIQHVSKLIQSSTIVQMAERDTMGVIKRLDDLEEAPEEAKDPEHDLALRGLLSEEPLVVRSRETGYLQYLDVDRMLECVAVGGETVVVEVPFGPGHFIGAGLPLARIWSSRKIRPDVENRERMLWSFEFGQERSFRQDFAFGLRQLSDIALKALSPGVNDPTTAMQALDRLEVLFTALSSKALPAAVRERRVNGARVLVKVHYPSFDDNVGLAFDQVRRAALVSGDVAVLERLLEVLERLLLANRLPERQRPLWSRIFAIGRLAPHQIPDERDAAKLTRRALNIGERGSVTGRVAADQDLEHLECLLRDLEDDAPAQELQETLWGQPRQRAS